MNLKLKKIFNWSGSKYLLFAILYIILGIYLEKIFHKQLSFYTSIIKLADVVTMLAALGGSLSAFYFQSFRDKDIESRQRIEAIREAIFYTISQYNKLLSLKQKLLEKYKNDPDRWYKLPALIPMTSENLRFNFSKLYFLLETDANFLLEMQIAQQSFYDTITAFNSRNEFHIREYQPRISQLEERGVVLSSNINRFKAQLGQRFVLTLESATNNIYNFHDGTLDRLKSSADKLHKIGKRLYPNEKFTYLVDQ